VVALAFAWLRPWQIALSLSIGALIPIFVSGVTRVEVVAILVNAAVFGALMIPPVVTHCYRNRGLRVTPVTNATPGPVVVAPVTTSPGQR
jgi:hypothetical protein